MFYLQFVVTGTLPSKYDTNSWYGIIMLHDYSNTKSYSYDEFATLSQQNALNSSFGVFM